MSTTHAGESFGSAEVSQLAGGGGTELSSVVEAELQKSFPKQALCTIPTHATALSIHQRRVLLRTRRVSVQSAGGDEGGWGEMSS
ncbi:MAG: hypothetical protein FWD69_17275 [Polyangiaceae bacterium]|nr:hypothetical protein [Polyangiaceae bacterium]